MSMYFKSLRFNDPTTASTSPHGNSETKIWAEHRPSTYIAHDQPYKTALLVNRAVSATLCAAVFVINLIAFAKDLHKEAPKGQTKDDSFVHLTVPIACVIIVWSIVDPILSRGYYQRSRLPFLVRLATDLIILIATILCAGMLGDKLRTGKTEHWTAGLLSLLACLGVSTLAACIINCMRQKASTRPEYRLPSTSRSAATSPSRSRTRSPAMSWSKDEYDMRSRSTTPQPPAPTARTSIIQTRT